MSNTLVQCPICGHEPHVQTGNAEEGQTTCKDCETYHVEQSMNLKG